MHSPAVSPATFFALLAHGVTARPISAEQAANHTGPGFVWLHAEGLERDQRIDLPGYVPAMAANALMASEPVRAATRSMMQR